MNSFSRLKMENTVQPQLQSFNHPFSENLTTVLCVLANVYSSCLSIPQKEILSGHPWPG